MKKIFFYIALIVSLFVTLAAINTGINGYGYGDADAQIFLGCFILQVVFVIILLIIYRKNFSICFNIYFYFLGYLLMGLGSSILGQSFSSYDKPLIWFTSISYILLSIWLVYITYLFSFKKKPI